METKGILHDDSQAARILKMTCDTLLILKSDGTCIDMLVKTENNPYINDQHTLLGKNIFDYFPEETVRDLKPSIEHVLKTGELSNSNYNLPTPNRLYYFKCIIQKYDDDHLLCQYRDITRRSRMKKNLEMAGKRLTEIERGAKIGYWTYNTVTKTFDYKGYVDLLMAENERFLFTMDEYLKNVYPKDREKIEHFFGDYTYSREHIEYRIMKDGELYYLKLKIVNIYRMDDGTVLIDGYTQNINDIVSKLNELKMVKLAVNNSVDYFYATKMDGTLIFANQIFRKQNEIPEDADITQYKVYKVLDHFEDEQMWHDFIETLRINNNTLKYKCENSRSKSNVISADCISYIIRNEYSEEIVWSLCRDISEQLHYEVQLKEAKEKAEESDRLKSAFLSNMSHEIRTPLNAIVGFSGIMADIDNAEERKKYFNIIKSSNKRLLLLINEVLDLSKIESGMLSFDYTPVKMNDLLREIFMTHQLYTNRASLVLEIPEEESCIWTDKNRLTQVISNLLNNAVKFTPEGTITIGYRIISDFVEFYVKDTGIGIPKDKVDKIFNRFIKVNDFAPGTGLGLSICKTIVERLRGEISVVSEEGVGSLFSFRIPLEIDNEEREEVQQPLSNLQSPCIDRENATILVAEDIDDNFDLIRAIIGSQYPLLRAKNGEETIELFNKYLPDLILMDIKMSEMSGLEVIKAIRKNSPTSPPIIAVSAYAFEEDKRGLLDIGYNDFVIKPLDKEGLLSIIHKYL